MKKKSWFKTSLAKWKRLKDLIRYKVTDIYQSGKGYKTIFKALRLQRTAVRTIIHKLRKLGTVVKVPRVSGLRKLIKEHISGCIQEVAKEPRATPKELQDSLASVKVKVHDSAIRKRLY